MEVGTSRFTESEDRMAINFTKLTFTDHVRKQQIKYGSRNAYSMLEQKGEFCSRLSWQERLYIESRDSFYMASVSEEGWPYVQFRGGPKGFIKVLSDTTLGYADFKGNGQYISTGNFETDKRTMLFFMDYPNKKRLKVWAESTVLHIQDHPDLPILEKVKSPDYKAVIERVITFKVLAYDWNCSQHIEQRYTLEELEPRINEYQSRINQLKDENSRLQHIFTKGEEHDYNTDVMLEVGNS